uniref:E3 ubiquitin-protein ligase BRE1A-like n=1 Tax=Myxine glutinosa TaxID=7769 RepID=UPI00358FC9B1
MAFVAQNFAVTPSEAQFRALLKSDLLKLAKHFNLEVRTNLRKAELQTTVIQSMVGLGTWDELAWEWLPEEPEDVELRKLELQLRSQERIKEEERKAEKERAEEERKAEKERAEEERKAEKERAEEERKAEERREEKQAEERRVEREHQERLEGRKAEERRAARELEAEERKAERGLKERDLALQQEIKFKELDLMRERGEVPPLLTGSTPSQNTWEVGRHMRLVPPFSEKEVTQFFPHFEKVARQLNWPEEAWTILVQSVLVGKAQEIYSALPMDQCADYEVLKKHILKAYELVPEAYRQKFRNARKRVSETHVEFARVKENMFDRWCESKGVGNDFEALRDLILVEEFQQCVHEDIKVYLQEKKVPKLWDAATMADDYALTHRIGVHEHNSSPRSPQGSCGTAGAENDNTWRRHRDDYGDNADSRTVRNQGATGPRQTYFSGGPRQTTSFSSGPTCAFCKKPGHLMSSCYLMKRENPERSPTITTPNAMASVRNRPQKSYQPFIYEGLVSLKGDLTNPRPVRVLRDT